MKKAYVYVGCKYVDAGEGRIAEADGWTAVMQDLADFISAISHHFKPLARDGAQVA